MKVDGFKSLKNFEITFKKGLNVLVGPNGAGKTNICQSLLLLSSLSNNTLLDSFTKYGGVQSTFNTVNCNQDEKRCIKISVKGESLDNYKEQNYSIKYNYSITLKLDEELTIEEEILHVDRKNDKTDRYNKVLSIEQTNNVISSTIHNSDLIGDSNLIKKGDKSFEITQIEADDSFMGLMTRVFFVCHLVTKDFNKIKSFNVDPNIARQSCDISEPNEMLGNGKYLANTLHFMNKKDLDNLEEINSILEQLIPNYETIDPAISDISLKRYFSLVDKNKNKFNSNSLSDGTIKLLATIVGILMQNEKTTIVEEPENFLHPYASKLLISYLRDTFSEGICILTTHSESILNQIKPEELIICELDNAFTKSHRIKNIREIKAIIENSGFGCGYHYVSGNFGGVPNY